MDICENEIFLPNEDCTNSCDCDDIYSKISEINNKMSGSATSENKVLSQSEIMDAINSVTAYPIFKDSNQGNFATKAELDAASEFYTAGGSKRTPTRNDYTYVLADETHNNKTSRYVFADGVWAFQMSMSDSAFTQAQLDALNSGITSDKIQTIDDELDNRYTKEEADDKFTYTGESGITITDTVIKQNVRYRRISTIRDNFTLNASSNSGIEFDFSSILEDGEIIISGGYDFMNASTSGAGSSWISVYGNRVGKSQISDIPIENVKHLELAFRNYSTSVNAKLKVIAYVMTRKEM